MQLWRGVHPLAQVECFRTSCSAPSTRPRCEDSWTNRQSRSPNNALSVHVRTIRNFMARDRWEGVATPEGVVRTLIPPVTFAGTRPLLKPVPAWGERTAEIIDWLASAPRSRVR